jgi:hypothetical protein
MAYVSGSGSFHVVRATSGEKGPFTDLVPIAALGQESLVMTVHDESEAVARITFVDWAAQVGTQPSPTAGWGFPVNAIEFSRYGEWLQAPGIIFMTLAATSVGRGFDTVGHRAGMYRNRIYLDVLTSNKQVASSPAYGTPVQIVQEER